MTDPAEKAIRSPRLSPSRQAFAVLAFDAVAIFIPTKPERPEKKTAGNKCKRNKPSQHSACSHNTENNKHHRKKHSYYGILSFKIRISPPSAPTVKFFSSFPYLRKI